MKVLVTNDDGPDSPTLPQVLAWLREAGHAAVAVVPERQRSASGLARTYHKPLRLRRSGEAYVVNGFPSDAVFLGLKLVAPDAHVVLSGPNGGENVGFLSVWGSGTVGAALQAGVLGRPAVALSAEEGAPAELVKAVTLASVKAAAEAMPPGALAAAVNVPRRWTGAVAAAARLALVAHVEELHEAVDPRGEKVYWRWGPRVEAEEGTDAHHLYRGAVTVVALGPQGVVDAGPFAARLAGALGARLIYG